MNSKYERAADKYNLAKRGEAVESSSVELGSVDSITRLDDVASMQGAPLTQAVLEVTSDAIVVTDPSGNIVNFNRHFRELWGIDKDISVGQPLLDVIKNSEDKIASVDECLTRLGAIVDSSWPETVDTLRLQNGQAIQYLSKVQLASNTVTCRAWSFRDIASDQTEEVPLDANSAAEQQRAHQNELAYSERQFDQLVAGIRDCAIYMLDPDGLLVSWNPGAQHIKGYSADEVIGKHFSMFFTDEDRNNGFPQRALELARANGKYETEAWRIRKDGARFWAGVLIDAIFDASGKLTGFAKITRDMTERRALQEQLHQSQKMEAIGQMTGGVAHDFNNLLTVIAGNLERLRRKVPGGSELLHSIEQAEHGAQRAAVLTRQLLAFARRQPLNPKPTNLNRLIIELADMFRRTLPESIVIKTDVPTEIIVVEVDPNQLESALLNLAVNARDAMPQGGTLTVEIMHVSAPPGHEAAHNEIPTGDYVVIRISDTGVGMTDEVLSRAFEPFYSTKPIGAGTGLGLSQVYGFVRQSGGYVRLRSNPGQGAAVEIYLLPMTNGAVEVEAKQDPPIAAIRGGETILLVEDDSAVRLYTTETLEELGFKVLAAEDATAALTVLDLHPEIDLLFTDVGLPGINGRELADEAVRRRASLRVLFTSGYERGAIMHSGKLDAGVKLLSKPFNSAQLATSIRDALDE